MSISKIMVALLVSVVAMAAMTGVAVADPATVTIAADPIINPLNGVTETSTIVTVDILDDNAGDRYISAISDNANLWVRVNGTDPNGTFRDTGWTNNSRAGVGYNVTVNATNGGHETYTFTVYVNGTQDGEITVSDNEGYGYHASGSGYDTAECTRQVMVPEFTTIALPALSILGLFLYFRYKRKQE